MQTFLPYENFRESARVLDYRRLGKQRLETQTLLNLMIHPDNSGYRNHPAFKMWDGYDLALAFYGMEICQEWIDRGYKDTLWNFFSNYTDKPIIGCQLFPKWLGLEKFHSSHRSALLYKDFSYYSQFGWSEKPAIPIKVTKNSVTLPYYWPTNE